MGDLEIAADSIFGVASAPVQAFTKEEADAKDGNGNGKKRLSGQSNKSAKKQKQEDGGLGGGTLRKCKRCKKSLPADSFYQSQGNCINCSKDLRNLRNIAKANGEVEWFQTLDESALDKLVQAYGKEKEKAVKERTKIKFSMTTYKERKVHAEGTRKEGRRRYMTEEQYYLWARTVDGGCLSKSKAEAKWGEYLDDPNTKRDEEGPNGELRLAIRVYTEEVDYDDVAGIREVEQQQRLSNKMTNEQLNSKVDNLVLAGEGRVGLEQSSLAKPKVHAVFIEHKHGSLVFLNLTVNFLSRCSRPL